jgi:hypothetical protein
VQQQIFLFRLKKVLLIFLLLFSALPFKLKAAGNDEADDKPGKDSSERSLFVALEYGTNRVSYEKKLLDQDVPYYSPSLSYSAPSGFYAGVGAYHMGDTINSWDEIDWTAGWDIHLSKTIVMSFEYSRFSYNSNSKQSRAELKNDLEYALEFGNDVLTPKFYIDYLFSTTAHDISFTLKLDHHFEMDNVFTTDDALLIKPGVYVSVGTVNALKAHADKTKPKNQKSTSSFGPTGAQFFLPLEYDIGRFTIEPAFYYSIPFSLSKDLQATTATYFTISVGYSIL